MRYFLYRGLTNPAGRVLRKPDLEVESAHPADAVRRRLRQQACGRKLSLIRCPLSQHGQPLLAQ